MRFVTFSKHIGQSAIQQKFESMHIPRVILMCVYGIMSFYVLKLSFTMAIRKLISDLFRFDCNVGISFNIRALETVL